MVCSPFGTLLHYFASQVLTPLQGAHAALGPGPCLACEASVPRSELPSTRFDGVRDLHGDRDLGFGGELRRPIIDVGAWIPVALRTPVPKTSVNENGNALLWENKVRSTWKWGVAAPAFDPMFSKKSGHSHFSGFIPELANASHVIAAIVVLSC